MLEESREIEAKPSQKRLQKGPIGPRWKIQGKTRQPKRSSKRSIRETNNTCAFAGDQ